MIPRLNLLIAFCLSFPLSACMTFGPDRVHNDRVHYNEAVAQSENEQMLLNIVRLRYQHIPVFIALSSVLSQYTYVGEFGIQGVSGGSMGFPSYSAGGEAGLAYAERPTLTYTPLSGDEFASQFLDPVPPKRLFSLVQSGWPPEQLLMMGLERLNNVQNLNFDVLPTKQHTKQVRDFRRVMQLITALARRGVLELHSEKENTNDDKTLAPGGYLVLEKSKDPETQQLEEEFRRLLGLDPNKTVFRVTARQTGREPDEITIRVRSLLAMMGFVSRGVEVPEIHILKQRASVIADWEDTETREFLFPLKVYSQEEKPKEAFVAVKYHDHWYFLRHSDGQSKRAFGLLTYLFQLQAPREPTSGPILTLPAGQ